MTGCASSEINYSDYGRYPRIPESPTAMWRFYLQFSHDVPEWQVKKMTNAEMEKWAKEMIESDFAYVSTDELKKLQKQAEEKEDQSTGHIQSFYSAIVAAIQS
jgi:hypothetical protein